VREVLHGRRFAGAGRAGPRRLSLPRTAALLVARGRDVRIHLLALAGAAPAPSGEPLEAEP
jgi:hypothetical protein